MKFTFSWLKEFLDTNNSVSDIVDTLNKIGLEVDQLTQLSPDLHYFKVAQITACEPHPHADRLKVCQVNTGDDIIQVVCGAPNARTGLKTVLARPGMYIPGADITIKNSTIRDVASAGMLCSYRELGLGGEANGIIEVSADFVIGESYIAQAGLDDPMIEIELTPNRGDCTSVYGIARDLAAAGCGTLKLREFNPQPGLFDCPIFVSVQLEDPSACSHFMGRFIKDVNNTGEAGWLKDRLLSIGAKSISPLVDVTNFMSYNVGRPMHVFDADKLQGNMVVRKAKAGETLLALDDKTYTLDDTMTVVADDRGVIAIAGIMGGKETGCTPDTRNVFIESAYFDPIHTAMTGQKLKIISDARYRFERGVNPVIIEPGLEQATQLIQEFCGGQCSHNVEVGEPNVDDNIVLFNPANVYKRGAMRVAPERMQQILMGLGFGVIRDKEQEWIVLTPSWRHDVTGEEDLIEEIMRIHGYDHIELTAMPPVSLGELDALDTAAADILNYSIKAQATLASHGFNECQTWSFIAHQTATLFGTVDPALVIENPISQDMAVMRPSLLPGLIQGIARNSVRGQKGGTLFEIGNRFESSLKWSQEKTVALVRGQQFRAQHWLDNKRDNDFYDIKADILTLLAALNIEAHKIQWTTTNLPGHFHLGLAACLQMGPKNILGYVGQIHPATRQELDVKETVWGAELYLERLIKLQAKRKVTALDKNDLQVTNRDFAFVISHDISGDAIVSVIKKTNPAIITDITIFDVYQGDKITQGYKSIALSVTLTPQHQAFTDAQLQQISAAIITTIQQTFKGELRS